MKLFLVRHGQTDWNIGKKIQGSTDIPLNQTGIQQAEQLRDQIRSRNLRFDYCYVSPLQRAQKKPPRSLLTANMILYMIRF